MSFFQDLITQWFQFFVDSFGVLGLGGAILVLILAMIIQAIIAPIASEAVLASAGGIFIEAFPKYGAYAAVIGGIIGSMFGAVIAFWIARKIQESVKRRIIDQYHEEKASDNWRKRLMNRFIHFSRRFVDEESEDFIEIIEERGFLIVLVGRMIPFVPFDAVSYASGFTRIRFKDFFIATFIGTIPRVIFYVLVGNGLAGALKDNFTLFIVLFVVFAGGIYGMYRGIVRYLKNQEDQNRTDKEVFEEASEQNPAIKRAEQVIENRECCKTNGSQGKEYCNVCGRAIPKEWIVEN